MATGAMIVCIFTLILTSCNDKDKDITPPLISTDGFTPANCDIYYAGDTLHVHFLCTDDRELGNFNIEVHNNFDHHTHSTEAADCDDEHLHQGEELHDEHNHADHADAEGAWVFNQDYTIPDGCRQYTADIRIPVPDNAAEGEYHLMLRLTDKAGWQTIKSVAIHIEGHF